LAEILRVDEVAMGVLMMSMVVHLPGRILGHPSQGEKKL
jgi:hypothetical protein